MAATDERSRKPGALAALMQAALALPIVAVPTRAGAIESGEVGITYLLYRERGLMRIEEPILWGRADFGSGWEVRASAAVDIVSGASPERVTNVSGEPVQTITAASITDRRTTADVKISRRVGEWTFGLSRAVSDERDYRSRAFGIEAKVDLNDRNTTLVAAYGHANDRIRSAIDPALDEPRRTHEYLIGVTQVLSPVALAQSTLQWSRGRGWYDDPYRHTLTFYDGGDVPAFVLDSRPRHRDTLAWLTRLRHHFPDAVGTFQADYRFYRDDWGIRAHTLDLAWQQAVGERWSVRPALRYHTQSKADFYLPLVPRPQPAFVSSDPRLAAFGGLSPSLRVTLRLDPGWAFEATAGYVHNAVRLRPGAEGNSAYRALRAYYGIVGLSKAF